MELTVELSREDIWQFAKFNQLRTPVLRFSLLVDWMQYALFILALGLVAQWPLETIIVSTFTVGVVSALLRWRAWKSSRKKGVSEQWLGKRTVEITPEGIRETTTFADEYCLWEGVIDIVENRDYIFVFSDIYKAYLIPKRVFNTSDDAKSFLDNILSFWKNAQDQVE